MHIADCTTILAQNFTPFLFCFYLLIQQIVFTIWIVVPVCFIYSYQFAEYSENAFGYCLIYWKKKMEIFSQYRICSQEKKLLVSSSSVRCINTIETHPGTLYAQYSLHMAYISKWRKNEIFGLLISMCTRLRVREKLWVVANILWIREKWVTYTYLVWFAHNWAVCRQRSPAQ